MDAINFKSPLATVQLIPIIRYLNLLSDFLFIENYLTEVDQNKQIPIVNALYEYLEQGRKDPSMNMKLIQNLLKGSDLYGERGTEEFDPIFVNSMFEYIISSLVFDKYGNIYGFLADIVRKVDNLNYKHVLEVIKESLKNATFENEYGVNSNLTHLAVNRIYSDIILPLFPQPKINLNLLSLDYIFAQAGSRYLRLGRINDTYYSDRINYNFTNIENENIFDEFLAIGHIIGNLLDRKKIDPVTLEIFALPILFCYTSTEGTVKHETITNVIFSPLHWEAAYHNFFEHVTNTFEQIENQLTKDNAYQLHLALLHFKNRFAMAKIILDVECRFLSEDQMETKIPEYIQDPERFQCTEGVSLPNIHDRYIKQILDISEIYGKYELMQIQQAFKTILTEDLRGVEIKLLIRDTTLNSDLDNFQPAFYDFIEFYFIQNKTSDYYALIRENYTVTLIKERDNPQGFRLETGLVSPLYELIRATNRIVILKFANESSHLSCEEFMKYKKNRFQVYLNYYVDNLTRINWWKAFGISLMPFYPCLLNKDEFCESNNVEFIEQFEEDISSYLVDINTRNLLSSVGTTIRTVIMKELIAEVTDHSVVLRRDLTLLPQNVTSMKVFFEKLSLHLEEPGYETVFVNPNGINLVQTIIRGLNKRTSNRFLSAEIFLNKMEFLKSSVPRNVSKIGHQILFVNSFSINTGYGYKFTFLHNSTEIAQLRTDYDFKDEILISQCRHSPKNEKIYFKLNQTSLEYETDYFVYEINNQLRRKSTQVFFYAISNHHDNIEKCENDEYLEETKYSSTCLRHWNFMKKLQNTEKVVHLLIHNSYLKKNITSEQHQIRDKLKKYTLPDDETFITYFVKNWLQNDNFEESEWSKFCIIENSDLLNKLRYDLRLDNDHVSIADGELRINSIYSFRERREIEEGTSLVNIVRDYNKQNASFLVTFEDYYAIRNFATTGKRRISGDTREAKLMKLALYKLAIRQSDDLGQEFDLKLFRVETKPVDFVNSQLRVGKITTLQKFTVASTNVESATRMFAYPASGFRNILYEMEFFGHYFRTKIETEVKQCLAVREKKVILLPGNQFTITKITIVRIGGLGNVLKVLLTFRAQSIDKYEWYKNIMSEISRISF